VVLKESMQLQEINYFKLVKESVSRRKKKAEESKALHSTDRKKRSLPKDLPRAAG